jgi:hypothetical protein
MSCTLAGTGLACGPRTGTGSASEGTPAAFTGEVSARSFHSTCTSSSSGGKPSRVGAASRSTVCQSASRVCRHRAITVVAPLTWAWVIAAASLSRSLTSRPSRSAAVASRALLVCQAWASSSVTAAVMTCSRPGTPTGTTWNSAVRRAAPIASVIRGSASIASRPTVRGAVAATVKPGSSSSIPAMTPATSRAIGPTASRPGASGRTPSLETRPQVVFRPAMPQQAAGMRMEPPVSVP